MARRNHEFAIDEYYHCYNRGTDKRVVFIDAQDFNYFIKSIQAYNSIEGLGKLRLYDSVSDNPNDQLVELVSYNLLPNHFHILMKERVELGISKFMQRLGIGYTLYFNKKYIRSGGLFQGAFKSKHIETDQDLRQVLAYVNYNYKIHNVTDENLYRTFLNDTADIVRDPNSNLSDSVNLLEVIEIIKLQRLAFD